MFVHSFVLSLSLSLSLIDTPTHFLTLSFFGHEYLWWGKPPLSLKVYTVCMGGWWGGSPDFVGDGQLMVGSAWCAGTTTLTWRTTATNGPWGPCSGTCAPWAGTRQVSITQHLFPILGKNLASRQCSHLGKHAVEKNIWVLYLLFALRPSSDTRMLKFQPNKCKAHGLRTFSCTDARLLAFTLSHAQMQDS